MYPLQSNEVKNSSHMEKEGLIRCVDFFNNHNINIQTLVTDRHVQIVKWVRENMPETTHYFDLWHVAKGTINTINIARFLIQVSTIYHIYSCLWCAFKINMYNFIHIITGLKKKLSTLSKEKDCNEIQPWKKSIVNHLYWVAATSHGLESEVVLARWTSLSNHIINVHTDHSAVFTSCEHGPLERRERHKLWLKPGS